MKDNDFVVKPPDETWNDIELAIKKFAITSFQLYYNGKVWVCRMQNATYISEAVEGDWLVAAGKAVQDFNNKGTKN